MIQEVPYAERVMSLEELSEHHDYVIPRSNEQDIKYLMIEHLSPLSQNPVFSTYELQMLLGGLYVDIINERLFPEQKRPFTEHTSEKISMEFYDSEKDETRIISSFIYPLDFLREVHSDDQILDDVIRSLKIPDDGKVEDKDAKLERALKNEDISELFYLKHYDGLLTGVEEKLFKIIYYFTPNLNLILSEAGRLDLAESVSEQSQSVYWEILGRNMGLVIKYAKKKQFAYELKDLAQEGLVGMIRAWKKFDYARGIRFSSYATWWVNQSVGRAVDDLSTTIRIPVHIREKYYRYKNRLSELKNEGITHLTQEEKIDVIMETNAKLKNETAEKLLNYFENRLITESLDKESDSREGGERELYNVLPDRGINVEDDTVFLRGKLDEILSSLTPRQRKILEYRSGMRGGRPHTLQEVGNKYGVTRERIRQIEEEAEEKLKALALWKGLDEFLR